MKIIQVTESFGGGVYSFLIDLCNDLAIDHEVVIVYSERRETPKNFKSDFHPSIRFIKIDMGLKKSLTAVLKLKNLIKEERPDVVHLHSSIAGYVGRIASKLGKYKGKLFYNPHGLAYLRLDLPKTVRKILYLAEKNLAKLGGIVIAVSESEKEEVKNFTKNVVSINNGIDIENTNKELIKLKPEGIKNKGEIIIGTIGRIEYQKNPKLFNQIAIELHNLKFLWIGDGRLRKELNAENIEVTGWINRKEVLNRLSDVDIYIQTSLWEGLPISVLEAMFMEKPLLLSNIIGNKDLVINGVNGHLFRDLNDFLDKIKNTKENKDVYGKNSRVLLEKKFNFKVNIKKYEGLYRK